MTNGKSNRPSCKVVSMCAYSQHVTTRAIAYQGPHDRTDHALYRLDVKHAQRVNKQMSTPHLTHELNMLAVELLSLS